MSRYFRTETCFCQLNDTMRYGRARFGRVHAFNNLSGNAIDEEEEGLLQIGRPVKRRRQLQGMRGVMTTMSKKDEGYVQLDYLQGNGSAIVITDVIYQSSTNPVEIEYKSLTYDRVGGSWAMVVGAGHQQGNYTYLNVSAYSEESKKPCYSVWFQNMIYAFTLSGTSRLTNTFRKWTFYKPTAWTSSNNNRTANVIVDNKVFSNNDTKWTEPANMPLSAITFFNSIKLDAPSPNAQIKWCGLKNSINSTDYYAYFTPVIRSRDMVAGMLDTIGGKFYPESNGKLRAFKDGMEISR